MTIVERIIQVEPQFESTKDGLNQLSEYLGKNETEKQFRGMYLINTRLWLDDLSKKYGTTITVGNVPGEEWDKMLNKYDNFWFMGIYKPSQKGQEIAKRYSQEYKGYLPDIDETKDIVASPFAIPEYSPNPMIAKDWQEWDEMVDKLHQRGKKVFIDFVPNHTALDHPWVSSNPEYYIQGNEQLYLTTNNFVKIVDNQGQIKYFAYGKDPNFGPWIDTLQLNYANLSLQEKMREELINLAKHADGFRCDMAMLINQETFKRSWGWCLSEDEKKNIENNPFWQTTIPEVKKRVAQEGKKNIEFIAEAYWEEQELGQYFDFIYNHDLYKHISESIRTGSVDNIKFDLNSLIKNPNQIKNHWIIYTENHDEKRAIEFMGERFSKPAAVLAAMVRDSIFMVNQGQESGCRHRPPMQVSRYRSEESNPDMARFYDDLLSIRRSDLFQTGEIRIINSENSDQNSILFEISKTDTMTRAIVAVNISQWTSFAQIGKDEGHLDIYNLTNGEKSKGDEVQNDKLTLKLEPGEVKIVCLSTASPENSNPKDACVLEEIQPRTCY